MKLFKRYKKSFRKSKVKRDTMRTRRLALRADLTALRELLRVASKNVMPVKEPLILISQIQRSGGTLLSQLLDGHPEIHSHPSELMIGYPRKNIWPKLNLDQTPENWFQTLFEDKVIEHFRDGYSKGKQSSQSFPFLFLPFIQKQIFLQLLKSNKPARHRDIFDAYMTSYFSAWLDYQNKYGTKKFVAAFTPRLTFAEDNVESFFEVYPEGRIISLVRDPKNWYPSAARHNPKSKKFRDIHNALNQWKENVNSILRNKQRWRECLIVLKFEDLVEKTKPVMLHLSNLLKISFSEILMVPTFNTCPIKANTSFDVEENSIIQNTLRRHTVLSREEINIIEGETRSDYEKVLDISYSA